MKCDVSAARGTSRQLPRGLVAAGLSMGLMLAACGGSDDPLQPVVDYSELKREVAHSIQAGMRTLDVRGLSIVLVDGDRVVWAQGFGMADAEAKVAADADTLYEIGSVSKLFTATAVMQQVESGRLNLDRPIDAVIPGFRMRARFAGAGPITLRHLLTHHAGLSEYSARGAFDPAPHSLAEQVEWLADDFPTYAPGQIMSYSNVGFTVLGRAVELAGSCDFASCVEQRVLAPLGMRSSAFRALPQLAHRMAKRYGPVAPEDMPAAFVDNDVATGGLRTSASDMGRFLRAMLQGGKLDGTRVLESATLQQMWRRQNDGVALDFDRGIGLGWGVENLRTAAGTSVRLVNHEGDEIYHKSSLMLLPDHGLGVVVLANTDSAGLIVEDIALDALRRALKARHGIELKDGAAPQPPRPLPRTDAALLAMAGKYVGGGTHLNVAEHEGRLAVLTDDGAALPLEPHEGGLFKLDLGDRAVWLSFLSVGGRDVLVGQGDDGRRTLAGARVLPMVLSDAWRKRLGTYARAAGQARELIERVDLTDIGGFVRVDVTAPLDKFAPPIRLLVPESEHTAAIAGLGEHTINDVVQFGQDVHGDYVILFGVRLRRVL